MKKDKKPFSKRVYPPRICLQCKEEFNPHDGKQKYCCEQHRIDFNNDKKKAKEKFDKGLIAAVKRNGKILEKIYESDLYKKHKKIMRAVLEYEGFDFNQYHEKLMNSSTGNEVLFCYDYGLECISMERGEFVIHIKK